MATFIDGVLAIIVSITVLERKVPLGENLGVQRLLLPVWFSYVLSYIFAGIYWNNHHAMLHTARRVSDSAMWPNLYLQFWLSHFPFVKG